MALTRSKLLFPDGPPAPRSLEELKEGIRHYVRQRHATMRLHVEEARYVRDYTVWLRFSDGTCGEVDLSAELEGPVFGPLRDIEMFKRFTLAHHTLAWKNGADLAPEFLREHAV